MSEAPAGGDDLDKLQQDTLRYFLRAANPGNGLIADSSREGAPCSIAATGFGLAAYVVGAERGFLPRREAAQRTLSVLRFFRDSPQGEDPDATGHRGFYYHFLDMKTGRRTWQCELSMMDTSILIAGALSSGRYFSAAADDEREIRELAAFLYERIDWPWATVDSPVVRMGWKPGAGFLTYGWEGYSEAMLLYVLGLGSPTHPLPAESYRAWTGTYQWENLYDIDFLFSAPLFTHQLSHVWIDFRGIQDAFNLADKLKAIWAGADDRLLDRYDRQRRTVAVEAVQQQTHRNQQIISERDPETRKKSLDAMRKVAADKTSAREYMLRSSMIASMRRAAEIE